MTLLNELKKKTLNEDEIEFLRDANPEVTQTFLLLKILQFCKSCEKST